RRAEQLVLDACQCYTLCPVLVLKMIFERVPQRLVLLSPVLPIREAALILFAQDLIASFFFGGRRQRRRRWLRGAFSRRVLIVERFAEHEMAVIQQPRPLGCEVWNAAGQRWAAVAEFHRVIDQMAGTR